MNNDDPTRDRYLQKRTHAQYYEKFRYFRKIMKKREKKNALNKPVS